MPSRNRRERERERENESGGGGMGECYPICSRNAVMPRERHTRLFSEMHDLQHNIPEYLRSSTLSPNYINTIFKSPVICYLNVRT